MFSLWRCLWVLNINIHRPGDDAVIHQHSYSVPASNASPKPNSIFYNIFKMQKPWSQLVKIYSNQLTDAQMLGPVCWQVFIKISWRIGTILCFVIWHAEYLKWKLKTSQHAQASKSNLCGLLSIIAQPFTGAPLWVFFLNSISRRINNFIKHFFWACRTEACFP